MYSIKSHTQTPLSFRKAAVKMQGYELESFRSAVTQCLRLISAAAASDVVWEGISPRFEERRKSSVRHHPQSWEWGENRQAVPHQQCLTCKFWGWHLQSSQEFEEPAHSSQDLLQRNAGSETDSANLQIKSGFLSSTRLLYITYQHWSCRSCYCQAQRSGWQKHLVNIHAVWLTTLDHLLLVLYISIMKTAPKTRTSSLYQYLHSPAFQADPHHPY